MKCFVCLDLIKDEADCIKWKSLIWDEQNVERIIEEHLWSLGLFQTDTLWLCLTCWDILQEFHKFYKRIKEAHINFECHLKYEPQGTPNAPELIAGDILPVENISEPKIEADHDADTKVDECVSQGHTDDNEIPFIQLDKDIKNSFYDCTKEDNEIQEDPLNKTSVLKKPFKKKRKLEINLIEKHISETEHAPRALTVEAVDDNNDVQLNDDEDEIPLMQRVKSLKRSLNEISNKNKISNSAINTKNKKNKAEIDCKKQDVSENKLKQTKEFSLPSNSELQIQINTSSECILKTKETNETRPIYFYESTLSCSQYNRFIAEHCNIACNECKLPFVSFSELQNHFRDNHKGRTYIMCCNTKFFDRCLLVDHINLHKNPEYFKCKHCPKILTLRRNFNVHMRCHDKPLSCDVCGKRFERKCFLNYHRQTHMSPEEKTIPCPDCGKFFASQYLLKNHSRVIHLKKYAKLCNICGQSLLNLESFKQHMKLHENKNSFASLSCEICGLLVSSERYLKAHMKSKHPVGGNTEKVCPICRKVLQNSDGLRHHIRRNHNTGYIHKCNICERAFKRIDHLKAHMNIHTGSDKSKCPWCPRTFNANSSMHHHRKKAHPTEWEEARRKKYTENKPCIKQVEESDNAISHEFNYSSITNGFQSNE